MQKYIKAIVAVVSGPVISWVADWTGIFNDTQIVRPEAAENLVFTANAIGAVAAIIVIFLNFNVARDKLKARSIYMASIAVVFVVSIYVCRHFLGKLLLRPSWIVVPD